jgi:nitrite reductase/ring-hydroxylating ferredoxin subunit
LADENDFEVVGSVDELPPGTHRLVELGRFGIGVYNIAGRYHALSNYCPHAGGPLCLGPVTGTAEADAPHSRRFVREGEIVRCPWHGWEFDITKGRTITEPVRHAQTFAVIVRDRQVLVSLTPEKKNIGEEGS